MRGGSNAANLGLFGPAKGVNSGGRRQLTLTSQYHIADDALSERACDKWTSQVGARIRSALFRLRVFWGGAIAVTESARVGSAASISHAAKAHAQYSLNTGSFECPIGEVAQAAKHAGFQGIEVWARDISDGLPAQAIRNLLEAQDLHLSAFQLLRDFEGSPEPSARLIEAEQLMAQMLTLGADTLLVCANTRDDSSGDAARIQADLRALADMAAERHLRIAFEPLAWSRWLNTYETATACVLATDHPALGLAIDAFHWFWGATPTEFARSIPVHKCFELQLSDARPDGSPVIEVARHHRLFPGEGEWPVAELVREFRKMGFEGYINLEVFNDAYRQLPLEAFVERAVRSINTLELASRA
jgi:4-hydroxyphenylpyruvate dioxygenase